jgi:NAD-dependent deacetylase
MTGQDLQRAAGMLGEADSVFVLSGAGMSTESGIPDFRGPNGLWTKHPEAMKMFDLDHYVSSPEVRRAAWQVRRQGALLQARPNAGHRALVDWEAQRHVTIATQNIDGLHQRAGSSHVWELHGTVWQTMCLSCDERTPVAETFARLDAGEQDPPCLGCGGILKSATVAFGQSLDPAVVSAAVAAAQGCAATPHPEAPAQPRTKAKRTHVVRWPMERSPPWPMLRIV